MEGESVFKTLEETLLNLDQRHSNLISDVANDEGSEEFLKLVQDLQSFRSDADDLIKNCPVQINEIDELDRKLKEGVKNITGQINNCFGKDPDYKLDLEQINDESKTV